MFKKVFGLEKIKQMNLPYPPYAIIESEKVTPSKIKEILKELQIPTIEGDRIGIGIRTSGAGRAGGRSDFYLMEVEEITNWALKLHDKNEPHVKLIVQYVVDARCSGVMLKGSKKITIEAVHGGAPSLLEGKTPSIERWTYLGSWKKEDEINEKILDDSNLDLLLKYSHLVPEYSYLEWSLSKKGHFYFYEFMKRKREENKKKRQLVRGLKNNLSKDLVQAQG